MKNFLNLVLAFLLFGLIITSANADIATIYPSDDMYSDPDHSGTHPADQLWVANFPPMSHHQRIMIKFDLSQISADTINNVTLNLYRFFGCPQGSPTSINIYEITQDWNENTWPGNQHIFHGTTVWKSYVFSANGWHNIDITSLVREWADSTINNYGLVIEAFPNNKFTKCYSKEASNQSFRPYLEVDYVPSVGIIGQNIGLITEYFLDAYPNPFNPRTTIHYQLPNRNNVTLKIFDMLGQEIRTLVNKNQSAGNYSVVWDGKNSLGESVGSGVYFYQLYATCRTGNFIETKKVLLVK
jgi:hypothetical protein